MRILESVGGAFPQEETWDAFVAQAPDGHLLQTWAWGELKAAFGWIPLRLALESDGTLVGGAQILFRRAGPFTVAYIPKGPVLLSHDAQTGHALWEAIRKCCHRMRAISLKVEPEWRDERAERHQWLLAHGLVPVHETIQPRRTIIVDLRPDQDVILARMKSKWRYNIRLSVRKGVHVRQRGLESIDTFYGLLRQTGQRDDFALHSLPYYRRAFELFAPSKRVGLFMAYYKDEPLAGLVAYAFNRQAWYMYGASSDAHRDLMPNHQLQWRAMQWAKDKGCTQYDLWGITDTDPESGSVALSGVERFKAGFGGEMVRYVGAYDDIYYKPLYWLLAKLWRRRRT